MASQEMSLEDYEAENYRRSHEGHRQPDAVRDVLRARVADMDAGRNVVEHDLIDVEKKAV